MATRRHNTSADTNELDGIEALLREASLDYPEAVEEFPWGERAIKVRKKIFVFMHRTAQGGLRIGMKLPESSLEVLALPFAEPTHYGMGKYGWVTFTFEPTVGVPVDLLLDCIEESFRAIAPKAVVAQLDGAGAAGEKAGVETKAVARKKVGKKTAVKKTAVRRRVAGSTSAKTGAKKRAVRKSAARKPTATKAAATKASAKKAAAAKKPAAGARKPSGKAAKKSVAKNSSAKKSGAARTPRKR